MDDSTFTSHLVHSSCKACRSDAKPLTVEALKEALTRLPNWQRMTVNGTEQIKRVFTFKNFAQAMTFTQQVAELAEQENHHPAILTEWGKVTVSWWTHEIGGLHQNDLICAAKTDQIAD